MTTARQTRVVLYHAISKTVKCNDGFAAAFCAWKAFGDSAQYIPYYHGGALPPLDVFRDAQVYFFDFAPNEVEQSDQIAAVAKTFHIIDHHKSSKALYKDRPYFSGTAQACSEAAWQMFGPAGADMPIMFEHIADNDLWLHRNPLTKAFIQRLTAYPYKFEAWEYLIRNIDGDPSYYRKFIEEGNILLEYARQHVAIIAASAIPITLNGVKGLCVNYQGPSYYVSAIGDELANTCGTFGATFVYSEPDKISFELRAVGNVDVSAIARTYGDGGGQENSSGFRIHPDKLDSLLDTKKMAPTVCHESIAREILNILEGPHFCSYSIYRKIYAVLNAAHVAPNAVKISHSIFRPLQAFFVHAPLSCSVDISYSDGTTITDITVCNAKPKWHWAYF